MGEAELLVGGAGDFDAGPGKVARLDASQLTTSSGAGMPTAPTTVLTSTDIGSASNIAFYPAPAGLGLAASLP